MSYRLKKDRDTIKVSIKEDIVQEVRDTIIRFTSCNVVPLKALQRFAGQCNHVAGIVRIRRPFLQELWAAIAFGRAVESGTVRSNAPKRCVWRSQIDHTLRWFTAFFDDKPGFREITFNHKELQAPAPNIRLVCDASPFGLGAYLVVDGVALAYFTSPLTQQDEIVFGRARGDSSGQQTWEALCVKEALSIWRVYWQAAPGYLEVRSDSVTALTMVATMRASGRGPGIVARELALLFASSPYRPRVVSHIPGVANKTADTLSRRFDPDASFVLPAFLADAKEEDLPPRPRSYYQTLAPAQKE